MVDPTRETRIEGASLPHGPGLSLDAFRAAATEVADRLGKPIAICRRPATTATTTRIAFVNRLLSEAERDGSEILEIVRPSSTENP